MSFCLEERNHRNLVYMHHDVLLKLSQCKDGIHLKPVDTGVSDDGHMKLIRKLVEAGIISWERLGSCRLTTYGRKLLRETQP